MSRKFLTLLGSVATVLLFAVALGVLHHFLKQYHYREVVRQIKALSYPRILLALALTFLSYGILTGYDYLAFRYIARPLAYTKIALTSFLGYVFSYNIGLSLLGGTVIRYRLYSSWGLSTVEITKVIGFCTLTFWLGLFTVGGVLFLIHPLALPPWLPPPFSSLRLWGGVLLLTVAGYLAWSFTRKTPIRVRGWEVFLPSPRLSLFQIGLSCIDWTLAGMILYVLLPRASTVISYPHFLGIFMLGQMAGLVSHVPGGLGVFETVILLFLSRVLPASEVLGSLLVYRAVYYLLPLMGATVLLGIHEGLRKKEEVRRVTTFLGRWAPEVIPHVFAFTTFMTGALLLFFGSVPVAKGRLVWLSYVLPRPVVEVSHFLQSLAGVWLLILARGLQQRLDSAYLSTLGMFGAGILLSLMKGLDYEEAMILALMFGALLPCRRYFYRKASLTSQPFTTGWVVAVVLILLGMTWLGRFAFRHGEYSHELWWQFAFSAHAPRFLRASVGAVSVLLIFAVFRLFRPVQPKTGFPSTEGLELARSIVGQFPKTYANLALLGDKAFFFSESKKAFMMYGIEGRSWIVMGDPVGPKEETRELLWQFHETCDRYGGWTVFYEVHPENLHQYVDLGLTFLKLGEEARVPLTALSLEGSSRKRFRHVIHRLEKEQVTFEIVPIEQVSALLPELKGISDAWLAQKNTREKGFSLGFFKEEYLKYFPVALVRKEGRMIAFANLWISAEREELSVDLMRYVPEAPHVMEYLFIQLMLWGRDQGYRWYNLGMAPLAGLEDRALAPLWNRVGSVVFRHGEHFYNFQGLRQFKDKFDPVWEPRYLASQGGIKLPYIFSNLASLISRGLKGVMAK